MEFFKRILEPPKKRVRITTIDELLKSEVLFICTQNQERKADKLFYMPSRNIDGTRSPHKVKVQYRDNTQHEELTLSLYGIGNSVENQLGWIEVEK